MFGGKPLSAIGSQTSSASLLEMERMGAVRAATRDVSVELEAAVEAPLVSGEIALGVLRVARAAGAGDRALDVGEARVGPLEPRALGRPPPVRMAVCFMPASTTPSS